MLDKIHKRKEDLYAAFWQDGKTDGNDRDDPHPHGSFVLIFFGDLIRRDLFYWALLLTLSLAACSDSAPHPPAVQDAADSGVTPPSPAPPEGHDPLPTPSVFGQEAPGVQAPRLRRTLSGSGGDEGWLSSPAVADLDQDGNPEIIAARGRTLYVWHSDGTLYWKGVASTTGRIWGPPVVADLDADGRVEVAVGSHQEKISVWGWDGRTKAGWPKLLGGTSEIRSLAAGVIQGNGKLGLLAARSFTKPIAFLIDPAGGVLPGWPQLSSATGCSPKVNCFEAGTYNQNVGMADLNGDGKTDMLIGYDTAYVGVFHQSGAPFAADPLTFLRPFFPGIPAFHDYTLAKKGFGPDGEERSEFTDSPPVVADLDGDGKRELILVGDHELAGNTANRGNALFVFHADATRAAGFESPFETAGPLVYDDPGANILDVTPAPAVADLDRDGKKEILFPSYDGNMYAVHPDGTLFWKFSFADNGARFASEPVVADLNNDGFPEIVFTTYEVEKGKGALVILSHLGEKVAEAFLPGRGAMAAPTLADLDGDGALEVIVNLKDALSQGGVQVYDLPGSKTNLILWPTGRGNFLRNGDATD